MGNLRAAPDWITPATADRVVKGLDRARAVNALRRIGLTGEEIVTVERIAAVKATSPEAVAGELVRAGIAAIRAGGFRC